MKRIKLFLMSALLCVVSFSAVSCGDDKEDEPTPEPFTITFDSDGGTSVVPQSVEKGGKVTKPADPAKEGFAFVAWNNGDAAYDFDAAVTSNLTLKAIWQEVDKSLDGLTALPGVSSVSGNKKVMFSSGNLQYQPSSGTWRFAEHQYDVLDGNSTEHYTANYTATSTAWIDQFGWGSWTKYGADPWKSSTDNDVYKTGIASSGDFENVCKEGIGEAWKTLSYDEWNYLIEIRASGKGIRYSRATVHGVNGLVLLPDLWDGTYTFANSNIKDAEFAEIADGDWAILESEGAVFLPAAGNRDGTSVYGVGSGGAYWSSTAYDARHACYVYFNLGYVGTNYIDRSDGRSVRLVRGL